MMEAAKRHPRVPGSLGRVLSPDGAPAGTGFQVAPGIVVTAWHVLAGLGCGHPGAQVRTDALGGGAAAEWATVTAVDDVRDLAVLRRARPLEESVPGWAPTDAVRLLTGVVVNGVAASCMPPAAGRAGRYEMVSRWAGCPRPHCCPG
jgi:hypothetical protein